jgi:hypothetical protein
MPFSRHFPRPPGTHRATVVRLGLGGMLLVAIVGLAFVWHAQRRWTSVSAALIGQLQAGAGANGPTAYREADLAGLPAPVARYFRTALTEGQPLIRQARIRWRGEFNLGEPGHDRWVPFFALQEFSTRPPGFVWDARMNMTAGIPVLVRDTLLADAGSMHGAVLGLVPIVDVHDAPTVRASALLRYLGEAVWFPTALLPTQGVRWEAMDASTARATVAAGGTTVSAVFSFGADGLIASIASNDRTFDDGRHPPSKHPWGGSYLRYEEHEGIRVPAESEVAWTFPSGRFVYWRGSPGHLEYRYAQ